MEGYDAEKEELIKAIVAGVLIFSVILFIGFVEIMKYALPALILKYSLPTELVKFLGWI